MSRLASRRYFLSHFCFVLFLVMADFALACRFQSLKGLRNQDVAGALLHGCALYCLFLLVQLMLEAALAPLKLKRIHSLRGGLYVLLLWATVADIFSWKLLETPLLAPATFQALAQPVLRREMQLNGAFVVVQVVMLSIYTLIYGKVFARLFRDSVGRPVFFFGAKAKALTALALVAGFFACYRLSTSTWILKGLRSPGVYDARLGTKILAAATHRSRVFDVKYPPAAPLPALAGPRDFQKIALLVAESFRAKNWNPELMPRTYALARELGCVTSQRHYSGGHVTNYGIFSILLGLQSFHYQWFEKAGPLPVLYPWMQRQGFAVRGASASALSDWWNGKFMLPRENYREYLTKDLPHDDAQVLAALKEGVHQSGPSFSFGFFNSTHYPYSFPADFEVDRPVPPPEDLSPAKTLFTGFDVQGTRNRYRNSVRYVDSLLANFLGEFKEEVKAGRMYVLFMGDHGEDLWDNDEAYGHVSSRFNPTRVQTPLLLCGKKFQKLQIPLSSHIDVVPTIFGVLFGYTDAEMAPFFDGHSLARPDTSARRIFGDHFSYEDGRMGVADASSIVSIFNLRGTLLPYRRLEMERDGTVFEKEPAAEAPVDLPTLYSKFLQEK